MGLLRRRRSCKDVGRGGRGERYDTCGMGDEGLLFVEEVVRKNMHAARGA